MEYIPDMSETCFSVFSVQCGQALRLSRDGVGGGWKVGGGMEAFLPPPDRANFRCSCGVRYNWLG